MRAVVVQGAGGNFCSGGDVHEIIGPLTKMRMPDLLTFTRMTGDLVKAMRACPQPIIAAIDGVCAGAGAIVAMASDLRVGTVRSQVAFLFSRVGLAGCDMGACAMLPRIIGQGRASELLLTGRPIDGNDALAWGFYNRLAPPEEVGAAAASWAAELAAGPTFGHAMTKRMVCCAPDSWRTRTCSSRTTSGCARDTRSAPTVIGAGRQSPRSARRGTGRFPRSCCSEQRCRKRRRSPRARARGTGGAVRRRETARGRRGEA